VASPQRQAKRGELADASEPLHLDGASPVEAPGNEVSISISRAGGREFAPLRAGTALVACAEVALGLTLEDHKKQREFSVRCATSFVVQSAQSPTPRPV
jgi:hypothetical protein